MGLQRWGGLMEGEAALASLLSRCPRRGAPESQHSKRKEPGWLLRPKEQLQQRQALELQCRQYQREMLLARHSLDQDLLRE